MQRKKLKIFFDKKTGSMRYELEGFKGKSCMLILENLRKAFGEEKIKDVQETNEFYEVAEDEQTYHYDLKNEF